MGFDYKIFVSTLPFGRVNSRPVNLLRESGISFLINPTGRKLSQRELLEFGENCEGIIAGTEDLRPLIEANKNLKIISRVGIGLDSVPLDLCKNRGIVVTYTPDAVTYAVAEMTVALMINVTRKLHLGNDEIKKGKWTRFQGKGINESTIGLIGFGRVGKLVTELLIPFKPHKILVNDIVPCSLDSYLQRGLNIEICSKEKIYQNSDILSLHAPKTSLTNNLINEDVFKIMKPSSYLINTSRGGIVNESALLNALSNKSISGAALDVFETEPYEGPLLDAPNIFLTQHMGSCSDLARLTMESEATEDIIRYFKGQKCLRLAPLTED